jgi:hypothetical protein
MNKQLLGLEMNIADQFSGCEFSVKRFYIQQFEKTEMCYNGEINTKEKAIPVTGLGGL